jgi:hypothetical protein
MAHQQTSSKILHIILWIAQVFLAGILIWASSMKLFRPVSQLALMWPWVGQVSSVFVKFTGLVDLLGALGLLLPALLRVKPNLTPMAALSLIVLMICASAFHIARGEAAAIGFNIVFALIAGFIAWGRFKKAPITAK